MSNSTAPATDPGSVPRAVSHSPRHTPISAGRPRFLRATPKPRNAVATIEDVCSSVVDPVPASRAWTVRAMTARPRDRRIAPLEAAVAR